MSIEFLKTKVDQINLFSPTLSSIQHDGEADSEKPTFEQESSQMKPIHGLERHGSTNASHRSQTTKNYTRAKSDSMFKHQNTLQVIGHKPIPSTSTSPNLAAAGSEFTTLKTNRSNAGNLMKAKSEIQFQPQSFLNVHKQIKAAISTPSSPIPVSPNLSSIKDSKHNLASSSFCDIFNSIASIPAQVRGHG